MNRSPSPDDRGNWSEILPKFINFFVVTTKTNSLTTRSQKSQSGQFTFIYFKI
jgi:hypothetical protein